jgi:hypothetical protein
MGYAPTRPPSQGGMLLLHHDHHKKVEPGRGFAPLSAVYETAASLSMLARQMALRAGFAPATALVRSQACTFSYTSGAKNGASPTNRTWNPTFAESCDICFTNEAWCGVPVLPRLVLFGRQASCFWMNAAKMVAGVGIAPTFRVFQTRTNLSQLPSQWCLRVVPPHRLPVISRELYY